MRYLLDSNICIAILKLQSLHIRRKLSSTPVGQVGISSIVLAELRYGIEQSTQKEKNSKLLFTVRCFGVNSIIINNQKQGTKRNTTHGFGYSLTDLFNLGEDIALPKEGIERPSFLFMGGGGLGGGGLGGGGGGGGGRKWVR